MPLFGACVICEQEKEGKNTEERATHRSKEKAKKESILISLTYFFNFFIYLFPSI